MAKIQSYVRDVKRSDILQILNDQVFDEVGGFQYLPDYKLCILYDTDLWLWTLIDFPVIIGRQCGGDGEGDGGVRQGEN